MTLDNRSQDFTTDDLIRILTLEDTSSRIDAATLMTLDIIELMMTPSEPTRDYTITNHIEMIIPDTDSYLQFILTDPMISQWDDTDPHSNFSYIPDYPLNH